MRAALGYERPTVQDYAKHWDAMRKWLSVGPKARIVITPDYQNNVGRLASIMGNADGRVWKLVTAMRDDNFNRFYLVKSIHTGEQRIVWRELLTSLY
jgi:hypothetical protein